MEAYKINPVLFLFALGLLAATKNFIQKKRENSIMGLLWLIVKGSQVPCTTYCTVYVIISIIISKQ